jgi:hypothetical protein
LGAVILTTPDRKALSFAIVQVAPGNCLVLTDDLPLANLLGSLSIDVVNFNHVRAINWGLA